MSTQLPLPAGPALVASAVLRFDGGTVFVPEFGTNAPDGRWVIEGHGVDPDIEVENDPASLLAGRDPQLERAVEEVLMRIGESPKRLPDRPDPPVKTK